jgi:hypothetical protein
MITLCERSGHDMAVGRAIPVPIPSDMEIDLDVIDQYRIEANKRKRDTEKRRMAFEKPPIATMM